MMIFSPQAWMPSRRVLILSGILIYSIFFIIYFRNRQDSISHVQKKLSETWTSAMSSGPRDPLVDVRNETLGFSKVFVVSLPLRSDKRDALSIAARLTGFKFEWIDGVDGNTVPQMAHPQGWPENESANTLGCWRAHMNVAQKMVKEEIQSALIFEDDADWDVNFKSQLVEFARGTRVLLHANSTHQETTPNVEDWITTSPYGDDWDLLWFGHCGAKNRENEDHLHYISHNDPTAIPRSMWGWRNRQPNIAPPLLQGNNTRLIYEPVRGLCMFGYGLSLRGAKRLLYHQSIGGWATVSDRALQGMCSRKSLGFKCLAPYPPLIGAHKPVGPIAKESDRVNLTEAQPGMREKAETGNIIFSTRLNMQRLVEGNEKLESQWPERTMLAEANCSLTVPQGRLVWITKDMYKNP